MRAHALEDLEIYQTWTVSQAIRKDWQKWNREEIPIKVIQTATYGPDSVTLSLPEFTCVYFHCTLFPLNKYSACFITSSVFMEILFCKVEGPAPCHWLLVQWPGPGALTASTQPQSVAWNRSPAQAVAPSSSEISCVIYFSIGSLLR